MRSKDDGASDAASPPRHVVAHVAQAGIEMRPVKPPVGAGGDAAKDERMDALVHELHHIVREAGIELSLRVGETIVRVLFRGSIAAWKARRWGDYSYRKLAHRRDLPMSACGINRAMRIYELWSELPTVSSMQNLSATHLSTVLGLPKEIQLEVLSQANDERWTVSTLAAEVARRRAPLPRRGRPRLPRIVRTLEWLRRLPGDAFDDVEMLANLSPDIASELAEILEIKIAELKIAESILKDRAGDGSPGSDYASPDDDSIIEI